jgi:hypothetical protein
MKLPTTASEVSDFIGANYVWRKHKHDDTEPHDDDEYCLTAHDLLTAFAEWKEALPVQKPVAWLPNDAIAQLEAPRLVLTNVPLVTYAAENHTAIYTAPKPQPDGWEQALRECVELLEFLEPEVRGGYSPDGALAKAKAILSEKNGGQE